MKPLQIQGMITRKDLANIAHMSTSEMRQYQLHSPTSLIVLPQDFHRPDMAEFIRSFAAVDPAKHQEDDIIL